VLVLSSKLNGIRHHSRFSPSPHKHIRTLFSLFANLTLHVEHITSFWGHPCCVTLSWSIHCCAPECPSRNRMGWDGLSLLHGSHLALGRKERWSTAVGCIDTHIYLRITTAALSIQYRYIILFRDVFQRELYTICFFLITLFELCLLEAMRPFSARPRERLQYMVLSPTVSMLMVRLSGQRVSVGFKITFNQFLSQRIESRLCEFLVNISNHLVENLSDRFWLRIWIFILG
jgi:hypothetical protein